MYILDKISLQEDETIEEYPICLTNKSGEVIHMGVLLKRRIGTGEFEGKEYYHYVDFYGKSPINFNAKEYQKLYELANFDMELEMIADFGYSFNNVSFEPGLGHFRQRRGVVDNDTLMPVSNSYRFV